MLWYRWQILFDNLSSSTDENMVPTSKAIFWRTVGLAGPSGEAKTPAGNPCFSWLTFIAGFPQAIVTGGLECFRFSAIGVKKRPGFPYISVQYDMQGSYQGLFTLVHRLVTGIYGRHYRYTFLDLATGIPHLASTYSFQMPANHIQTRHTMLLSRQIMLKFKRIPPNTKIPPKKARVGYNY